MIDLWINNNIAQQLWRGHTAPFINLDANGLRQGCVLSPILYLLIIDSLMSKAPNTHMPDWDNEFIKRAFMQGVQTLEDRLDLGDWLVYLFVDDTAFVSRDILTTNELLKRYQNFTRKWRIRINPDKCKVLQNEHCTNTEDAFFGDDIVKTVEYLKYLGYWIGGTKGRLKNDEHIRAKATQLRFKIRTLRQQIGEQLTRVYLESYATPAILHGAELGSIANSGLE